MHSNDGTAEALAQRERLVENTMVCCEDLDLETGRGRDVAPRRIPSR